MGIPQDQPLTFAKLEQYNKEFQNFGIVNDKSMPFKPLNFSHGEHHPFKKYDISEF
jgi:hypothetical protein